MSSSVIPDLSALTPAARAEVLKRYKARESMHLEAFYCVKGRECDGDPHEGFPWQHARGDQWPPPGVDWFTWIQMGGRGSGKTRTGSEYTRQVSKKIPQISLIGQTATAVRDVMIEDPDSGIIRVFERYGERVRYEPTKRRISLPNGAIARVFSAEEPDRLRGPQHGFLWFDEPAHYPKIQEVWDMALLGLRKGGRPHILLTTTPLPTKWMKARIAEVSSRLSRVSTYANLKNLAPATAQVILSRYEGTRLGRQELHGEILEDVEGALWAMSMIEYATLAITEMTRIVVGIDPAGSVKRTSDETGIVVGGISAGIGYAIEDATGTYTPDGWARRAIALYEQYSADAIVVERNYGGDMVKANLKAAGFTGRIIEVTATRGKKVRAEPIVNKYEQHLIKHFPGLEDLEDEQTTWVPESNDPSPNRVDALVWVMTELMLKGGGAMQAGIPRGKVGPGQGPASADGGRRKINWGRRPR
jgi:phage terminase large subunit-like protein